MKGKHIESAAITQSAKHFHTFLIMQTLEKKNSFTNQCFSCPYTSVIIGMHMHSVRDRACV